MSGWERVVGTATASTAQTPKSAGAKCCAGKKVVGGGYVTASAAGPTYPYGYAMVTTNAPTNDFSWSATAVSDVSVSVPWSLQAFALCVASPAP